MQPTTIPTKYTLLKDLISYYQFDGDSTDKCNSNDAIGTNISYGKGKKAKGAIFDGISSIISVPERAKGGKSFAISIYFSIDGEEYGNKSLYSESSAGCFNVYLNAGAGIGINHETTTAPLCEFNSKTGLFSGDKPVFIIAEYDHTTGYLTVTVDNHEAIRIFRGGEQKYGDSSIVGENVIGAFGYGSGTEFDDFFKGTILEIGLWGRGLSPEEKILLFKSTTGSQSPFIPSPYIDLYSVIATSDYNNHINAHSPGVNSAWSFIAQNDGIPAGIIFRVKGLKGKPMITVSINDDKTMESESHGTSNVILCPVDGMRYVINNGTPLVKGQKYWIFITLVSDRDNHLQLHADSKPGQNQFFNSSRSNINPNNNLGSYVGLSATLQGIPVDNKE